MTDQPISSGSGAADDPWRLQTPPLSSSYTMHRDQRDGLDVIVCNVRAPTPAEVVVERPLLQELSTRRAEPVSNPVGGAGLRR